MRDTKILVQWHIPAATSSVARAILGGRVAQPEGQNKEENEKILRKK